jgi:hypothetical protein
MGYVDHICCKEGCKGIAHWEIENLNGGETVYSCNEHIHVGIEWDNTARVSSTLPTYLGNGSMFDTFRRIMSHDMDNKADQ